MRFQSGFVGPPSKLAHAFNGNYYLWDAPMPKSNTWKWKQAFFLPNGMKVFESIFYGKEHLWFHFVRRSKPSYLDVSRLESPRLYRIMLRAVPSRGGGPGCRWHKETTKDCGDSLAQRLTVETLSIGSRLGLTTTTLTIGIHLRMDTLTIGTAKMADNEVLELDSQCGYRNTHRTTSRGSRSQAALTRLRGNKSS